MVSPRNDKEVSHMSPEQYDFLKKTWTSATPIDILMWNRKDYRQLIADSGNYQVVSHYNINTLIQH